MCCSFVSKRTTSDDPAKAHISGDALPPVPQGVDHEVRVQCLSTESIASHIFFLMPYLQVSLPPPVIAQTPAVPLSSVSKHSTPFASYETDLSARISKSLQETRKQLDSIAAYSCSSCCGDVADQKMVGQEQTVVVIPSPSNSQKAVDYSDDPAIAGAPQSPSDGRSGGAMRYYYSSSPVASRSSVPQSADVTGMLTSVTTMSPRAMRTLDKWVPLTRGVDGGLIARRAQPRSTELQGWYAANNELPTAQHSY